MAFYRADYMDAGRFIGPFYGARSWATVVFGGQFLLGLARAVGFIGPFYWALCWAS